MRAPPHRLSVPLTHQATAYGQCVQTHAEAISLGVCGKEFAAFLSCASKATKKYDDAVLGNLTIAVVSDECSIKSELPFEARKESGIVQYSKL